MSFPTRNNPYSFDEFLAGGKTSTTTATTPSSRKCSGTSAQRSGRRSKGPSTDVTQGLLPVARLCEKISWPEHRPYMKHYDGHNHRIDRSCGRFETEIMEKEIFSEAFFSSAPPHGSGSPKCILSIRTVRLYRMPHHLHRGMVALLEKYADTPETRRILKHCKEGSTGFRHRRSVSLRDPGRLGCSFNVLEAESEGEQWRLYGTKFFLLRHPCRLRVVTQTCRLRGRGPVRGAVLARGEQGERDQKRLHHRPHKWKMGTSESPRPSSHSTSRWRIRWAA
jgi:hypothetical protein